MNVLNLDEIIYSLRKTFFSVLKNAIMYKLELIKETDGCCRGKIVNHFGEKLALYMGNSVAGHPRFSIYIFISHL